MSLRAARPKTANYGAGARVVRKNFPDYENFFRIDEDFPNFQAKSLGNEAAEASGSSSTKRASAQEVVE